MFGGLALRFGCSLPASSGMAVSRTLVGFPSWTPPFMEITYLVLALLLAATLTLGLVMTA